MSDPRITFVWEIQTDAMTAALRRLAWRCRRWSWQTRRSLENQEPPLTFPGAGGSSTAKG